MRHPIRTLRAFALALVCAIHVLFSTRLRVPLREMSRAWRRAYGVRLLRAHGFAPIAGGATIVGQRSPLYWKMVAGGLPVILDASKYTGNIFYVDSAVGTDGDGYGTTPDAPFDTIDYAIGKCTASQGDVILVCPSHAESTTAITCDKAGISIIGLGHGNSRPAITGNAVADVIAITAADVLWDNVRFPTPSAAVTALFNIAAARAKIRHCWKELGANIVDAVTITEDGEMPLFEENDVIVTANGPDSWIKFEGVVDLPIIRNNRVIASDGTNPFDDGVIDGGNQAVTNLLMYGNEFGDGNQAVTVLANGGNFVGEVIGPNYYGALATSADTVPTLADGSITAATIAAAAIDAATFAADALQAFQDEAEDALEGENLDHLAAVTDGAGTALLTVIDGSILSKIVSKVSGGDTSSFTNTTDSLEMLSDKLGAYTGDGGAGADDSVKAELDLIHTDVDAILADTGTDGVVLAADAITAAKIADDAIAAEHIATGAIVAATFAAGAIDAAAIAAAAIDAATFAADALQAMQDEAEDALEGENLDHLLTLDGATQVYPEQCVADSIIAKMIAKGDPATPSTYSCVTDSQEALSDKLGGFSGDGGAAQDDSTKASLDLAHTDLDAIIADTQYLRTLDGATQVYPENVAADSIIAKMIAKGDPATPSTYSCVTDSQEALSDKLGGFSGDGGAAQDDSVKASMDLAHTDLDAILADTGTDGVVIAADGITAAKIADNAFASEHFAASAGEKTTDGVVITRATAAVPQSTSATIFTVTGLCLLKRIVGRVTTVLGAATPNNSKLKVDTTGAGATTDICTDLDLDAEAEGTILQITGTFANAMVATLDLPIAKQQAAEIVIPPGSIQLECDGSDGGTGRIQWSVTYVPLESGASIVAA